MTTAFPLAVVAAIYARKSTDQAGVADDQKSVARQIAHATAYANAKGWSVPADCVFVDDGVSGAEFATRLGFTRMMNAAKQKPRSAFDVLVMSEESRLGRESIETAYALKELITAGVRVFFYLEDRERTLDSPTDKVLLSLTTYADELERERARVRTYDAMSRKAKAGHVTGGRVFGYDNVPVLDDAGRRVRVDRRVNEPEAAVVREIFERCVQGEGVVTITKALNARAAPAPRAQQGRPRAWAPSSVREVLHRELYRGVIVWGQTKKRNQWGQLKPSAKPAAEHVRVDAPHLRIVSDALWRATHTRLDDARQVYLRGTHGQLWGRPASGVESKYLLTGLVRCAECGGGVYVRSRAHGRRRAQFYGCSSYHYRGCCENGLEIPMATLDGLVLDAFEADILRPDLVERAINRLVAMLRPSLADLDVRRAELKARRAAVDTELERLTAAIAAGGELTPLVAALKEREAARQRIRQELASLGATDRIDVRQLEREAWRRLSVWRELLTGAPAQARQMLKKLLAAPLQARPVRTDIVRGWEVTGRGSLGKLLSGMVPALTGLGPMSTLMVASPSGIEPESRP